MLDSKLLFLIFLISTPLLGDDCFKNLPVKPINGDVSFVSYVIACTNSDKTTLYSIKCKEDYCGHFFRQKLRENSIKDTFLFSSLGNPGFKICRMIGGSPRIIEFKIDGNWFKLDWCLMDTSELFIDTGLLMKFYLQQLKSSAR